MVCKDAVLPNIPQIVRDNKFRIPMEFENDCL